MSIRIDGPLLGMGAVCERVLADLPEWFGIEEANRNYVQAVDELPTFVAREGDDPVGFMSLLVHAPESAELYVLGVVKARHRQGIGKQLLAASEFWLKGQGIRFVQVKTLAPTASDEGYEKTRKFYEGQGYVTLEIFPELWDPGNPALQMIKHL